MKARRVESLGTAMTVAAFFAASTLLLLLASPLQAETSDNSDDAATSREQLFQEIAGEVAALERQGNLLKKVVRLVTPTVAHIEAAKSASNDPRSSRRSLEEAGSGVIVEYDGALYVLSNRHVIKDSSLRQIKIKLSDGRVIYPSKVWMDRASDVAVMAVSARGLTPARLGNSDEVEIGDFVLAVGSPFGLSHSVTYGIISAKGRRDLKLGDGSVKYQDFLQTDAAINPGNSGGPLLNLRGEVIGVNTAIASSSGGSEGIGFSIPIKMAMQIATQLIERGAVVRAYLGVRLDSRFDAIRAIEMGLPRLTGALVTSVTPRSPAATADVRPGDVILKLDGIRVEDDTHLVNLVSLTPVGDSVELLILRGGKTQVVEVNVGNRGMFEPE
jgi:serine protease Do